MKELKVLYIAPYPHGNRTTGGNEAVAQALASTLALQPEIEAVQVIAFPRNIGEYQRVVLNAKLTVHYVPGQRRFGLPTGMVLNVLWARRYAGSFAQILFMDRPLAYLAKWPPALVFRPS